MAGPSPAPRRAQLAAEDANDFEMRAVLELVHRRDPLDAVAAGDEDRGIAHEGPGIAGDADDDRDSCCGELPCLCLRPGARGIDHERVETLELRCEERAPEKVARLRRDAAQARRLARGLVEGGKRAAVAVDGLDLGALGETQREGAAAGEEVGDPLRPLARLDDDSRERLLPGPGRLQEAARRRRELSLADAQERGVALDEHVAVQGETGEVVPAGDVDQSLTLAMPKLAMAAEIDVETGLGRGELDVERLSRRRQWLGERERRLRRLLQRRLGDRAEGDLDELVAAHPHVADARRPALEARMQRDPPPPGAMRVDERLHRRVEAGLAESVDENGALPARVEGLGHVLRQAAAAAAEIGAERRD